MFKKSLLLTFLFFFFLSCSSLAATHYVASDGSDTWANSTNISTPTDWSTAMTNATAGDLVYFRDGTYNVGTSPDSTYHGVLSPANSGSSEDNRIIFKAYPNETPIMNGTAQNFESKGGDLYFCRVFGFDDVDYVTIDGFTIQSNGGTYMGSITVGDSNEAVYYISIKNCTINGGTHIFTELDNAECIRLNKAYNTLIHRCYIYDVNNNMDYGGHNGYKSYTSYNTIIEYCEFDDCEVAIYTKSTTDGDIFRYNWIHDCPEGGIRIGSSTKTYNNTQIYHNVLANNGTNYTYGYTILFVFGSEDTVTNHKIYNNTIYAQSGEEGIEIHRGTGWELYNNISICVSGAEFMTKYSASVDEHDHNQFGSASMSYYFNGTTYTSLANWRATSELASNTDWGYVGPSFDDCGSADNPGCGSLASNPLFADGSGNLNALGDFRLQSGSPCIGTGRSSLDMGADIDKVGLLGDITPFLSGGILSGGEIH